jgi:hypothetical protein
MDYNSYYTNQAKNELTVFRGATFQRGSGFGDVFKKFFRWIVPIVKKNSEPVLRTIGKEALHAVSNIANDTLQGKNFKESVKNRLSNSLDNISKHYGEGKRKKSFVKKRKKRERVLDIFDHKKFKNENFKKF